MGLRLFLDHLVKSLRKWGFTLDRALSEDKDNTIVGYVNAPYPGYRGDKVRLSL